MTTTLPQFLLIAAVIIVTIASAESVYQPLPQLENAAYAFLGGRLHTLIPPNENGVAAALGLYDRLLRTNLPLRSILKVVAAQDVEAARHLSACLSVLPSGRPGGVYDCDPSWLSGMGEADRPDFHQLASQLDPSVRAAVEAAAQGLRHGAASHPSRRLASDANVNYDRRLQPAPFNDAFPNNGALARLVLAQLRSCPRLLRSPAQLRLLLQLGVRFAAPAYLAEVRLTPAQVGDVYPFLNDEIYDVNDGSQGVSLGAVEKRSGRATLTALLALPSFQARIRDRASFNSAELLSWFTTKSESIACLLLKQKVIVDLIRNGSSSSALAAIFIGAVEKEQVKLVADLLRIPGLDQEGAALWHRSGQLRSHLDYLGGYTARHWGAWNRRRLRQQVSAPVARRLSECRQQLKGSTESESEWLQSLQKKGASST